MTISIRRRQECFLVSRRRHLVTWCSPLSFCCWNDPPLTSGQRLEYTGSLVFPISGEYLTAVAAALRGSWNCWMSFDHLNSWELERFSHCWLVLSQYFIDPYRDALPSSKILRLYTTMNKSGRGEGSGLDYRGASNSGNICGQFQYWRSPHRIALHHSGKLFLTLCKPIRTGGQTPFYPHAVVPFLASYEVYTHSR